MRDLNLDEIEYVSGGIETVNVVGYKSDGGGSGTVTGASSGGSKGNGEAGAGDVKPVVAIIPIKLSIGIGLPVPNPIKLSVGTTIDLFTIVIGGPGNPNAGNNEMGGLNSLSHK
jgi:hypothetical protein